LDDSITSGQPKLYLSSGRRELLRRRGSRGSSSDIASLALSATSPAIDDEYQASCVTLKMLAEGR
jgi:hypothetical protein